MVHIHEWNFMFSSLQLVVRIPHWIFTLTESGSCVQYEP